MSFNKKKKKMFKIIILIKNPEKLKKKLQTHFSLTVISPAFLIPVKTDKEESFPLPQRGVGEVGID